MSDITVYLLSIVVGVSLIIYGKRKSKKLIKYLGVGILIIDIVVPIASFIAGVVDGMKSIE